MGPGNQTTVQMIQEVIQEDDESQARIKYDVMFQNKAVERTFEQSDIQTCLHQPRLLIDKKLYSLHQITEMSNEKLEGVNARIINREDHVHLGT